MISFNRIKQQLLTNSTGQRTVCASLFSGILTIFLLYLVSVTRSLVITGVAWISVFSFLSLVSALVSLLTSPSRNSKYTYGTVRGPVLAVFSTTVLAQLSSVFLIKESFEQLLESGHHHGASAASTRYFFPAAVASSASLLVSAYALGNHPFSYVLNQAQSSIIQEHAADISSAICYMVPRLSQLLLPRINTMTLLALISSFLCVATDWFLPDFWWFDAVATLALSFVICTSMTPLSTYTGKILLQTTPPHIQNQIDRCISEASTVEGVLELRNSHFWQLDFGTIVGSVDVRVRRDANEQRVLKIVRDKLCSVVNICSVQVLKDISTTWNYQRTPAHFSVDQQNTYSPHSHSPQYVSSPEYDSVHHQGAPDHAHHQNHLHSHSHHGHGHSHGAGSHGHSHH